jgi:hypothetical protein
MKRSSKLPNTSSKLRLCRDAAVARREFRRRRLDEPLADYDAKYPNAFTAAQTVIESLTEICTVPADSDLLASFVGNKAKYAALRSLAATPISHDDLQTLLHSNINKKALTNNQELADKFADLLRGCLDPHRFPWIAKSRPPTKPELSKAVLATSVLTAVSAVQAGRRGDERKALEGRIRDVLDAAGFVKVSKPKGGIQILPTAPKPGQYMTTCKFGEHNSDFVIGLMDGRIMAIECKASNSEVNGFKRLNKEVVVDARDWLRKFGESNVIAAAALRGVFNPTNVGLAQDQNVYIFWWHRIRALEEFLTR